MKVYLARQPILDINKSVVAYELLYRDGCANRFDKMLDGTRASRRVISDALTTFGLPVLTNRRYAFINFTRDLLMSGIPTLLNPREVVIELLEDIQVDGELLERLAQLKEKGFLFALDDFINGNRLGELFDYIDIIKVDFRQTSREEQAVLAKMMLHTRKKLLAEKVETAEEFEWACENGYVLFQGYFFAKPSVFSKRTVEIASATCFRVLRAMTQKDVQYEDLAEIIRVDVGLSYRLLTHINSIQYYRSHRVMSIKDALVRMGMREVRRWILLVLIRDATQCPSDEGVRIALTRGIFCEKTAVKIGCADRSGDAFTTGMFSMIDAILEESLPEILQDLCIPEDVKDALLGSDNLLGTILRFAKAYEEGDWDLAEQLLGERMEMSTAADLYLDSVRYTDEVFDERPSGYGPAW